MYEKLRQQVETDEHNLTVYQSECNKLRDTYQMLKNNISIESTRTEKLKSKLTQTTLKVRSLEKLAG